MSDANYSKAGYGSVPIGRGTRPAILVVDFQTAFTDPQYTIGGLPMIHAAVDRTAALLDMARPLGIPVAKCYTAYGSQADMPRWKVKTVREEFIYGHPCTAMEPKVDHPSDYNFCKNAPSIFFHTPLITFLASDRAANITGQCIGLGGDKLALWTRSAHADQVCLAIGMRLKQVLELDEKTSVEYVVRRHQPRVCFIIFTFSLGRFS
jgi:hypothetical protein